MEIYSKGEKEVESRRFGDRRAHTDLAIGLRVRKCRRRERGDGGTGDNGGGLIGLKTREDQLIRLLPRTEND